jgi:hypothetical protein
VTLYQVVFTLCTGSSNTNPKNLKIMTDQTNISSDLYCIDLPEAQKRVRLWRAEQRNISEALAGTPGPINPDMMSIVTIKAFTFRYAEILDLVGKINHFNINGETPISGLRFYLGIREAQDHLPAGPCLIAVAVNGYDPANSLGGQDILDLDAESDRYTIFDFSYPCPSTCATVDIENR